jgi:hypothetical protein
MGLHKYPYLKDTDGQLMVPFDRSSFWSNLMEAYFPCQMSYYSREEYLEHERPDLYSSKRSFSGTGFREIGDESEKALLLV